MAGLALAGTAAPATAQVQRSVVNLGFEEPVLGKVGCRVYIAAEQVIGWTTSAPSAATEQSPANCAAPLTLSPTSGRILEIWRGPRDTVTAREGAQFAELNAAVFSRLSQQVCLVGGETIRWSFSHRGRGSATVADVAEFLIGAQPIVRVQTTNTGAGGIVATTLGSATDVLGPNSWRDYKGEFVAMGVGGPTNIGFNAVSSFGSDPTSGNFLDNIRVQLRPFVEMGKASFSTLEGTTVDLPTLRVLGTVPEGGMTVKVAITGGTATLNDDYTPGIDYDSDTSTFSVTIPEGDYGGGQNIDLGFAALADAITPEADETVTFSLVENPDQYLVHNVEICGGTPLAAAVWTIRDAAPALQLVKTGTRADTNNDSVPSAGDIITYKFAVTNTGNVALTNVTIADTLPGVVMGGGPLASLAVGATDSTTFTGTYVIKPADMTNGNVTNIAQAHATPQGGGNLASNPSSVVIPLTTAPAISIVKSGSLNDNNRGFAAVGDVITYSFLVTNIGNTALSSVTIADNFLRAGAISGLPIAKLAIGASVTRTATYTVTQADINAGSVTNIATASGTPPSGPPVTDSSTKIVPVIQAPKLALTKAAGTPSGNAAGATIAYSFTVTNTGNVPLHDVDIVDPQLSGPAVCLATSLAIGAGTTCTGSHVITQAEVDAGTVTNTARAIGQTPGPNNTPVTSTPATATKPLVRNASYTVVKTVDQSTISAVGPLTYTIKVKNSGNVSLGTVTLTDTLPNGDATQVPAGPAGDIGVIGTLEPGEEWTYTIGYAVTQAEINLGDDLVNRVDVLATPVGGAALPRQHAVVTTITQNPSISVVKSVDLVETSNVDQLLTYTIKVTNNGNVALTGVTLTDTLPDGTAGALIADPGNGDNVLDIGEEWIFTTTYTAGQADFDSDKTHLVNEVAVTADLITTPVTDTATTVLEHRIEMLVEKRVDLSSVAAAPTTLTYTIDVTNTGTNSLTNVVLEDSLSNGADLTPTGPAVDIGNDGEIAAGETWRYTATYAVTAADIAAGGPLVNTVNVTTDQINGSDTVDVAIVQSPRLLVAKTVDVTNVVSVGTVLNYTLTVTNAGNVPLTNVALTDLLNGVAVTPALTASGNGDAVLDVGEAWTYAATHTVTAAEMNAGADLVNVVTVAANGPGNIPLTPVADDAVTTITQTPALTVAKTVDKTSIDEPGDLNYTITVTNEGNVTLTGVVVTDLLPGAVEPGVTLTLTGGDTNLDNALDVDEVWTYSVPYTVDQAAIDAGGTLVNTVSVISTRTPVPVTDTAQTFIVQTPALTVAKTAAAQDEDGNGFANAGDSLDFTFVVTNTGNVTLTDVTPRDTGPTFNGWTAANALSAFSPDPVTLEPGDSQTFTASYVLHLDDVIHAAGVTDGIENSADATGQLGDSPVTSPFDTAIVTLAAQEPGDVTIAKEALLRQIRRGETIPFAITATNNSTGNVGLVDITDRMPPAFAYVPDSAKVNGVPTEPVVSGRDLLFADVPLGPKSTITITLTLRALASAAPGHYENVAIGADDGGSPLSPPGEAGFDVIAEGVFDCSDIIGKVFDDRNRNGYQDEGEPGLPGVRLATTRGILVTTDKHGRYSIPCAALPNPEIGSNFVLKVDARTLPTGYHLTTRNPEAARLTAGKMAEINFGASIGRQVRVDLDAAAFVAGEATPGPTLAAGLDTLVEVLAKEQSTLVLTYRAASGGAERLAAVEKLIRAKWRDAGGPYTLGIESRLLNKGGQ